MTGYSKQLEKYKSVDIHSSIETADPHGLIVLLLKGALTNLTRAIGFIQQNNIQGKTDAINKSIAIIDGLMGSIDNDQGGEVAKNLTTFYKSVLKLIINANINNDISLLTQVKHMIGDILNAWEAIKQS